MGLPGCLFVCHLILLLVCFLFNCNIYSSYLKVLGLLYILPQSSCEKIKEAKPGESVVYSSSSDW